MFDQPWLCQLSKLSAVVILHKGYFIELGEKNCWEKVAMQFILYSVLLQWYEGLIKFVIQGPDSNATQAFRYQQQDRHQPASMRNHLDPTQPSMGYPYPPAQHHMSYMDPYYTPHQNPNQGMDGYGMGMQMNPNPQMPNPNHGGFTTPFQAPGGPRMYPQPLPRHAMEAPGMAGMPHVTPYQREQQRLQTMHRFHSHQHQQQQQQQQQQHQQMQQEQLPQQQHQQLPQQQLQQQVHRQPSGPAPSGKSIMQDLYVSKQTMTVPTLCVLRCILSTASGCHCLDGPVAADEVMYAAVSGSHCWVDSGPQCCWWFTDWPAALQYIKAS